MRHWQLLFLRLVAIYPLCISLLFARTCAQSESPKCRVLIRSKSLPALPGELQHIGVREVYLYDLAGKYIDHSKVSVFTSSVWGMSYSAACTWVANIRTDCAHVAQFCNDGNSQDALRICLTAPDDPNPRIQYTYDCPNGITSLSAIDLYNRADCCLDKIEYYQVDFLNADDTTHYVYPINTVDASYHITVPKPDPPKSPPPSPTPPPPPPPSPNPPANSPPQRAAPSAPKPAPMQPPANPPTGPSPSPPPPTSAPPPITNTAPPPAPRTTPYQETTPQGSGMSVPAIAGAVAGAAVAGVAIASLVFIVVHKCRRDHNPPLPNTDFKTTAVMYDITTSSVPSTSSWGPPGANHYGMATAAAATGSSDGVPTTAQRAASAPQIVRIGEATRSLAYASFHGPSAPHL